MKRQEDFMDIKPGDLVLLVYPHSRMNAIFAEAEDMHVARVIDPVTGSHMMETFGQPGGLRCVYVLARAEEA